MSFVVYSLSIEVFFLSDMAIEVGFDELHLAFLDNLCSKNHQQNLKHNTMIISYAQYNKMVLEQDLSLTVLIKFVLLWMSVEIEKTRRKTNSK